MDSFAELLDQISTHNYQLEEIRIWQNGRTNYSWCYELDVKHKIGNNPNAPEFVSRFKIDKNDLLSNKLLESYGVIYLKELIESSKMDDYLFDSDNGQVCCIIPWINSVITISAKTSDQCHEIVPLINHIMIPELRDHPRDNSMLNELDALYEEYYECKENASSQ